MQLTFVFFVCVCVRARVHVFLDYLSVVCRRIVVHITVTIGRVNTTVEKKIRSTVSRVIVS